MQLFKCIFIYYFHFNSDLSTTLGFVVSQIYQNKKVFKSDSYYSCYEDGYFIQTKQNWVWWQLAVV
jgi:hypothetical protein